MWYKYPEEESVMRMLLCACLITVALGFSPVVAWGDAQSHRRAAENLLIVMEVDKSLRRLLNKSWKTSCSKIRSSLPNARSCSGF
jgi:hypothetical protein